MASWLQVLILIIAIMFLLLYYSDIEEDIVYIIPKLIQKSDDYICRLN